jgi:hypothetical protein
MTASLNRSNLISASSAGAGDIQLCTKNDIMPCESYLSKHREVPSEEINQLTLVNETTR